MYNNEGFVFKYFLLLIAAIFIRLNKKSNLLIWIEIQDGCRNNAFDATDIVEESLRTVNNSANYQLYDLCASKWIIDEQASRS